MNPEFLLLSLIFSFLADILFLKTSFELAAILLFIAVQYCHRRLLKASYLSFTLGGFFGMLFLLLLSGLFHIKSSLLTAAAFFYIALLIINLISSLSIRRQSTPRLFCICLFMLFACDLHVGLFNLPRFTEVLSAPLLFYCTQIAGKIIWLFYLPSQLIMLYLFFCAFCDDPSAVLF